MPFFFSRRPVVPGQRRVNEGPNTSAPMGVIVTPFLLIAAIVVSLFFVGRNIVVFSVSQTLLMLAVLWTLWSTRVRGLVVPATVVTVTLSLYWAWFALTLLWSPIPFVSVTMFWWLSSLPLAYWAYVAQPGNERRWRVIAPAVLAIGLTMGAHGIYQFFKFDLAPRSIFLDGNILAAFMYMLALPACGYFLLLRTAPRSDRVKTWLSVALFGALVYVLMLTRSRGGLVAFLAGTVLLLLAAHRHVTGRTVGLVAGTIATIYLLADLSLYGGLSERAVTLVEPVRAGAERFSIWRQSWKLLFEQSPVWGIGLGLYSLVWPPYREPTDTSGGFFVHNDYLQTWIEAGLPGLLLFLAFLGSVAWAAWRLLRRTRHVARHIEISALLAAFAAVLLHSLVQYNFYVMPLLLMLGLGVARLWELETRQSGSASRAWVFKPLRHLSNRSYGLILLLAALLPLGYFFTIGISTYQSVHAADLMGRGEIEQAERALILAERLWPDADMPRVARADLYRVVMLQTEDAQQKRALFQDADSLLKRAETLNPLRPNIYLLRADLYRQARPFTGPAGEAQVEADLRRALALDPRHYPTRLQCALFLLERGREQEAADVLEAGMPYRYLGSSGIVPYLEITAWLRERRGDDRGAAELRRRIAIVLEQTSGR